MSRDGLLPKQFSRIHPKFKTPGFSTVMTGVVVGMPIFFTDEAFVLDFTSIGTIFAFVLVCGGVLLLPKRDKSADNGFRLWYINGKWAFAGLVLLSACLVVLLLPKYINEVAYGEGAFIYVVSHRILWLLLGLLAVFTWFKNWNLIPLLGVAICLYLLTGMTLENWKWFGLWFLIGIVFYLSYGRRKSKLNEE
jgi:amino acid transporter